MRPFIKISLELAERFAQYGESGKVAEPSMVQELRAILAAPIVEADVMGEAVDCASLPTDLIDLFQDLIDYAKNGKAPEKWMADKLQATIAADQLQRETSIILPERKDENCLQFESIHRAQGWNECINAMLMLNHYGLADRMGFKWWRNGPVLHLENGLAIYPGRGQSAVTLSPGSDTVPSSGKVPVKVVLPERKNEITVFFPAPFEKGWNACLDKVKELNQ